MCVEGLRGLMGELETSTRECFIFSVGQRSSWETISEKTKSEFRRMVEETSGTCRVYFVPVEAAGEENLAVSSLEFAEGTIRKSSSTCIWLPLVT